MDQRGAGGEHGPQHGQSPGEGARLEKDPGQGGQDEGDRHLPQDGEGAVLPHPERLAAPGPQPGGETAGHLIDTVEQAPDHEGEGGAVPQAADGEHEEDVEVFAGPSPAAAAQGDVQVVAAARPEICHSRTGGPHGTGGSARPPGRWGRR